MNTFKQNDINNVIGQFQVGNNPKDRYTSFDYCYRYFLTTSSKDLLADIEKSCLVLGFYLASWGMFRGKSFLLGKSAKHYVPLVEYIARLYPKIWQIDVDNYTDENKQIIVSVYNDIKNIVIVNDNSHLTLVTKIMLGVFGFVPAYDRYFRHTFGGIFNDCKFTKFNVNSLNHIQIFYQQNQQEIDRLAASIPVTDFISGKPSQFRYTKAKIIDMYGFTKGFQKFNP
jgi:hypothetical protein